MRMRTLNERLVDFFWEMNKYNLRNDNETRRLNVFYDVILNDFDISSKNRSGSIDKV